MGITCIYKIRAVINVGSVIGPRGRLKKTWREIVEKNCQVRGLNREDAMDRKRWMKQIRDD